jgi:hypothetical protein
MIGAARLFFTLAIAYIILGMSLGLHMGMSENHGQMPTHAHIMLVGWVTSALVAYFYHQFPAANASRLAMVHFGLHTVGSLVMVFSLWQIYSGNTSFEPGAGIGAIIFLLGMVLFAYVSLRQIWKA